MLPAYGDIQKIHSATAARIFRRPFCYLAILWPRWREIFRTSSATKTFLKGCACFRKQRDNDDGWFWNTKSDSRKIFYHARVYPQKKLHGSSARRKSSHCAFGKRQKGWKSLLLLCSFSENVIIYFLLLPTMGCLFYILWHFWFFLMNCCEENFEKQREHQDAYFVLNENKYALGCTSISWALFLFGSLHSLAKMLDHYFWLQYSNKEECTSLFECCAVQIYNAYFKLNPEWFWNNKSQGWSAWNFMWVKKSVPAIKMFHLQRGAFLVKRIFGTR